MKATDSRNTPGANAPFSSSFSSSSGHGPAAVPIGQKVMCVCYESSRGEF
jgi:hypothetical protein